MKKVFQGLNVAVMCLLAVVLGAELMPKNWPGPRLVESAQSQDAGTGKMVLIGPPTGREPSKVIKITENGQTIIPGWAGKPGAPGQPFAAGEDWLSKLSFVINNRTSLTIAYVGISLRFEEDQHYDQSLQFGQIPAAPGKALFRGPVSKSLATGPPLHFCPGQRMTISLYGYVDSIKAAENTQIPFSNLTKLEILYDEVFFEDQDLIWARRGYLIPDTTSPDGVKPLKGYFPGDLKKTMGYDADVY